MSPTWAQLSCFRAACLLLGLVGGQPRLSGVFLQSEDECCVQFLTLCVGSTAALLELGVVGGQAMAMDPIAFQFWPEVAVASVVSVRRQCIWFAHLFVVFSPLAFSSADLRRDGNCNVRL